MPPSRGWNSRRAMVNPRPPAVPATLDINLEEYFTAAGSIGLLSAQIDAPDPDWAADWSINYGEIVAAKLRARRKRKVAKITPKRKR